MAVPSARLGKSWTFTFGACPFLCHFRPPFLKFPTRSFFLVSTETTGSPCARNRLAVSLRYRNWRSRPTCEVPSLFFRFAKRGASHVDRSEAHTSVIQSPLNL